MEPDELTDDLEVEEQDETADEDVTAAQEQNQEATTPTVEERLAKAEAEAAKFRRLFEKAKKPQVQATETTPSQAPSAVDVEETVLKANGMPSELLVTLKKVAQVEGKGLIEAQASDLFVAAKAKFEKDEKSKAAAVGASRGSGRVENRKTLNTPNLSREEHMRLVKG